MSDLTQKSEAAESPELPICFRVPENVFGLKPIEIQRKILFKVAQAEATQLEHVLKLVIKPCPNGMPVEEWWQRVNEVVEVQYWPIVEKHLKGLYYE